jgi:hypothetical protein
MSAEDSTFRLMPRESVKERLRLASQIAVQLAKVVCRKSFDKNGFLWMIELLREFVAILSRCLTLTAA